MSLLTQEQGCLSGDVPPGNLVSVGHPGSPRRQEFRIPQVCLLHIFILRLFSVWGLRPQPCSLQPLGGLRRGEHINLPQAQRGSATSFTGKRSKLLKYFGDAAHLRCSCARVQVWTSAGLPMVANVQLKGAAAWLMILVFVCVCCTQTRARPPVVAWVAPVPANSSQTKVCHPPRHARWTCNMSAY
jgi:hypothetical protein